MTSEVLVSRESPPESGVEAEARLCVDQWNRDHDSSLQVRLCDLEWNLRAQELVSYRSERICGVPVIHGTATDGGARLGVSQASLWISLWGEVPETREAEFIDGVEKLAARMGKSRLVFGADEFHFVSGVPLATAGGLRLAEALKGAGYRGDSVADFVGLAKSAAVDAYVAEAEHRAELRAFQLRPVDSDERLAALDAFLSREFPGRWTREFRFWRSRSDCGRAFWRVLTRAASDEVLGFARMAVRSRVKPGEIGWTPGSLRLPLWQEGDRAARWDDGDACLGPIGIAKDLRGQGAGRALLGRVLAELRSHNAGRICIDWTDAFKYYEPLRFEKVRIYHTAWKNGVY